MSNGVDLTLEDIALLEVLSEAGETLTTEEATERLTPILRERGLVLMGPWQPPWFAVKGARTLEHAGLIEVHGEAAEFVPRESPAPSTRVLFLTITHAGEQKLGELREQ